MILFSGTPASAAGGDPLLVTSTGLNDGGYLGRTPVLNVAWTGDASVVEVLIDGVSQGRRPVSFIQLKGGAPVSVPDRLNGTDVPLTVRVSNAAGDETAEKTTTVHVDTDLPTFAVSSPALLNDPAGLFSDTLVHGVVPITVTAVSDDTVDIRLVDISTGRVLADAAGAPWAMTWDSKANPGQWVHYVATDRASNRTFQYGGYNVDNAGPVLTGVSGYPGPEGQAGRTVTLTAAFYDQTSVTRVEWWIDGVQQSTGPTVIWNTGTRDGLGSIDIRAWDQFGQQSDSRFGIPIDNTAPTVAWNTPAARALVRGRQISSTIAASDPSGIRQATLTGGRQIPGNPYGATLVAGKDGTKTLTWTVLDREGNPAVVSRTVTVDNTRPSLRVTKAPKNKAKVTGTVKIRASASDHNGVNRVELLVNGKVVGKDTTSGYAFSLNPRKYGKTFKVQLRAYDRAGNATTSATYTWRR
jgi:Bacterial Ig domain